MKKKNGREWERPHGTAPLSIIRTVACTACTACAALTLSVGWPGTDVYAAAGASAIMEEQLEEAGSDLAMPEEAMGAMGAMDDTDPQDVGKAADGAESTGDGDPRLSLSDLEGAKGLRYKDFDVMAQNGLIDAIHYSDGSDSFYAVKTDGTIYIVTNPDYAGFKHDMLMLGIDVLDDEAITAERAGASQMETLRYFLGNCIWIVMVVIFIIYLNRRTRNLSDLSFMGMGMGMRRMPIIQPEDDEQKKNKKNGNVKKFSDVAGLAEVKKDMQSLVDFIKRPDRYQQAGARLPKGVILYGPPGTGKTLLARAVAGEAGVPFIHMSGSDFVEIYVGTGAKRVRQLFREAREKAPCIVFIDEIDAMGGNRSRTDNSEDRKTINALLTEMDGFKECEGVLVIGATNRISDLDPALLRPGRFTDKFCVPLPQTKEERREVIKIYSEGKRYAEDVDLDAVAKETTGFSPAQIESLLNESAIVSVQDGKRFIDRASIDKAWTKMVLNGHIREDQKGRRDEELEIVAWHEAGHALIGYLSGKDVTKVTILSSTSGAGGATFSTPPDTGLRSASDLENEVMELYGGRIAELLFTGDRARVTTGASNDIERATQVIHELVVEYGMSDEFGLLNLEKAGTDPAKVLTEEIAIAKRLEAATKKVAEDHIAELRAMAGLLLEQETIYAQDIEAIMGKAA